MCQDQDRRYLVRRHRLPVPLHTRRHITVPVLTVPVHVPAHVHVPVPEAEEPDARRRTFTTRILNLKI